MTEEFNNNENQDETQDYSEDILTEEEAQNIFDIQNEWVESYVKSREEMELDEWLQEELSKHLPEKSSEEIAEICEEITDRIEITEQKKEELEKSISTGRDKNSWLASELTQWASYESTQEAAALLQELDDAVKASNETMFDTVTTRAGVPNMNPSLDGFIAEQHHVNSFNMKSQAVGSDVYAEVLKPKPGERFAANSVDIVIKDSSGKIIRRYQAKYGATADATIKMIKEGNYRGQQLLVPAEQVEKVQAAFPDRKVSAAITEGSVSSKPLTKEEALKMRDDAQKGNFLEKDWSEYATKDLAQGIASEIGKSCLMGVAVGAGMNILSKVVKGDPIDGQEVVETAIVSGADFGVKTAVAAGLKVAAEKEIIHVIPKGTPAGALASIAFVAVENAKVAGKVASGELSIKEGVDKMEQTTVSCVAGIAASAKGTSIGAVVGSVLGPVGTAIGGFVGGCVGYIAGSKVGEAVVKGYQKIRDKAKGFLSTTGSLIATTVGSFARGLASLFGF